MAYHSRGRDRTAEAAASVLGFAAVVAGAVADPRLTRIVAVAIVRAPEIGVAGTTQGLIEFVDLYPTLMDLLGLEGPDHLEGASFRHLLEDPGAPGKQAVFPRWKNADVVKTERYALTTWTNKDGRVIGEMMFDHETDRDENINVVDDPDYGVPYTDLKKTLDLAK